MTTLNVLLAVALTALMACTVWVVVTHSWLGLGLGLWVAVVVAGLCRQIEARQLV